MKSVGQMFYRKPVTNKTVAKKLSQESCAHKHDVQKHNGLLNELNRLEQLQE